jgi:hypothetical protein
LQVPKWWVIGRNEYRILTCGIPKIRPYFLYIAGIFLVFWVLILAPAIVQPVIDHFIDIPDFFLSIAAVAFMMIILFFFFIYLLIFPISYTLRDIDTEEYEIFLSAPIKPGDVLLGKFMGILPIYAILIVGIMGLFTAFLKPLKMDAVQIIIINLIFLFTLLSALWIGTVIAALLRTKLGKTAKGRDIGKGLSMLIALPMVALMYTIMAGNLMEVLANPNNSELVKWLLYIFPSSWGAELIVEFAVHPGDIHSIWFITLTHFGGIVLFFFGSFWVGLKTANRAYSFEYMTFTSAAVNTDGFFYNTVNKMGGGGSGGILLVSAFKNYVRRLQNISWLAYIGGLIILLMVFFIKPSGPNVIIFLSVFIYGLLPAIVIGDVTLRGKDTLFIYRKAPDGESRFIQARLLQSWLIVVPIVVIVTSLTLVYMPETTLLDFTAVIFFAVIVVMANTVLALGLFLIKPVFSEKSGELMINIMVISLLNSFAFFFFLILFDGLLGTIPFMATLWIVGIVVLIAGKNHLSKLE